MSDQILVEDRGLVRVLTLNRPEARNALDAEMVKALLAALGAAKRREETAALILTGAGKAFCAGADLAALQKLQAKTVGENLQDSRLLMKLYRAIRQYPKPIAAAVNGPAIAGGCGLMTVCDYAVASAEHGKFGYPEVRIGFVAALVMVFLRELVGDRDARDLLLSGRLVDAHEAQRMGLIHHTVPHGTEVAAAESWCLMASQGSPMALAQTKALLHTLAGQGTDRALRMAAMANVKARLTDDCKEGVAAFLEKRPARFRKGGA